MSMRALALAFAVVLVAAPVLVAAVGPAWRGEAGGLIPDLGQHALAVAEQPQPDDCDVPADVGRLAGRRGARLHRVGDQFGDDRCGVVG